MTVVGEQTVKVLLAAMPGTRQELAGRIGKDPSIVGKWTKRLHEARKIHILRYTKGTHGGPPQMVFARGRGVDAKSPPPLPSSIRSQRQRDKVKAPIGVFVTCWAPWHPWSRICSAEITL